MEHLELFTDGGAMKIGDKIYGSSSFVIRYHNTYFTYTEPVSEGSSGMFELNAIKNGLQTIVRNWSDLKNLEIWIISDSQNSIACISNIFDVWKKTNGIYKNKHGKEVAYIDILLDIKKSLSQLSNYKFIKIKSHIDTDVEKTYDEFLEKNEVNISFIEYLMMIRHNERCDNKITSEFNYKRKELAKEKGVDVI